MKPADIRTTLNYIGGEFVTAASGKTWENRSPVDGSLISMVSEAGQIEVDAAVATEINRRFDEFLEAEVADTGKPVCIHSSSIPNFAMSV